MLDLDIISADVMLNQTKTCNRCKETKVISFFTVDRHKKDGLRTICKACTKIAYSTPEALMRTASRIRELRKQDKWKKYYAERAKAWRKTEKGKAYERMSSQRMIDRHPLKHLARIAVNDAVRYGRLTKLPCFCCGNEKVEAHHPDYDRPLDVIWLCKKHHSEIHHARPK